MALRETLKRQDLSKRFVDAILIIVALSVSWVVWNDIAGGKKANSSVRLNGI